MPYRRAHLYLLLLLPLAMLAFWPAYFSNFAAAPAAFHVHGITASLSSEAGSAGPWPPPRSSGERPQPSRSTHSA